MGNRAVSGSQQKPKTVGRTPADSAVTQLLHELDSISASLSDPPRTRSRAPIPAAVAITSAAGASAHPRPNRHLAVESDDPVPDPELARLFRDVDPRSRPRVISDTRRDVARPQPAAPSEPETTIAIEQMRVVFGLAEPDGIVDAGSTDSLRQANKHGAQPDPDKEREARIAEREALLAEVNAELAGTLCSLDLGLAYSQISDSQPTIPNASETAVAPGRPSSRKNNSAEREGRTR